MDIRYRVSFFSCWHCGSGLSAGFGIDQTVARDADGLPFIPGKTLKGMLRDAATNLSELADNSNKKDWEQFVNSIFGTGSDENAYNFNASGCFFSDAALGQDIRLYLSGHPSQKAFLFNEISATAIVKDTGVAAKGSLRITETVIPLDLEAEVADFPDNNDFYQKLGDCMNWIKRMGVNRNRGLGRCCFSIIGGRSGQ